VCDSGRRMDMPGRCRETGRLEKQDTYSLNQT
jgi:hypothetical protein